MYVIMNHVLAGLAFLPFVWAVNTVWFFNEAFRKPTYDEQKEIKKCMYLYSVTLSEVSYAY